MTNDQINPFIEQTSTNGRPFRVSGVEKLSKANYRIIIKYLDDNTFAKLYQDYNNKIYKVEKL